MIPSKSGHLSGRIIIIFLFLFGLAGCEDTDLRLVAEAGMDALTAITLSDESVHELSLKAALHSDSENIIASVESDYLKRVYRITGEYSEKDGFKFDFKVYMDPAINAFAMANGSIRIYSGLMEMMNDNELRFVIGHEMGHIVKKHIHKKIQLAYAGSALRKGIASQNNEAGELARSQIGGFAEQLLNAQFSQQEEREADDYGLGFLENSGYGKDEAISALRKLASLGANHSFLSSHPAPAKRAERLEGKSGISEDNKLDRVNKVLLIAKNYLSALFKKAKESFL